MQVASLLTSNERLGELFRQFLIGHESLFFDSEDQDTMYFCNKKNKYEFFYHFKNDIDYEFSYNFTERSIAFIRNYFQSKDIFLLDVSFRDRDFFLNLIKEFIKLLQREKKADPSEIIIDDPVNGVATIDNSGNITPIDTARDETAFT